MVTEERTDVRSFIDERPLSTLQIAIVALVALVIAFDGMDVVIMGFAAPEIIRTWGIGKTEMGTVLSSVFFGMAAGAALAGPVGDRFGRKFVIVLSIVWFGMLTSVSALAPNVQALLVLRALAGLGLGASIPSALALMAEYAPYRKRSLILTIAFSGFTAGATLTGFLAAWLIPNFGWQTTLCVAGLLPLAFALLLTRLMPESVAFLALRGRSDAIRPILKKIDPKAVLPATGGFWLRSAEPESQGAFSILSSPRYVRVAALLAVAYFMGVLDTYVIVGWLPVIAKDAGFSLAEGAIITSIFTLAGPLGSICLGLAMDRVSRHWVLVGSFAVSALLLASVGIAPKGFGQLCAFMLTLGFFFHGTLTGMQALAPQSFPTAARATGVSIMHAVGRIGAIGSGILGGIFLGWGWSIGEIFLALAFPMLAGGFAIAIIGIGKDRDPIVVSSTNSDLGDGAAAKTA